MGKSGLRDGWDGANRGDRVKKRCEGIKGKWRGCERGFRGRVKLGFRRGEWVKGVKGRGMLYAVCASATVKAKACPANRNRSPSAVPLSSRPAKPTWPLQRA